MTEAFPQTFLSSLAMPLFNRHLAVGATNRRGRRSRGSHNRRAAAAVEFALTAPLFFLVLFAGIEFSRANILRNLCENAALEAARRGMVPGATAENCTATANSALELLHVKNATVEVEPSTILPGTPEITINVSIPLADNAMPMSAFVMGTTLTRSITLERSR